MTEEKAFPDDELAQSIFEIQDRLLTNLEPYIRLMFGSNKTIGDIFWRYPEEGAEQMRTLLAAWAPKKAEEPTGAPNGMMTALLAMREDGKAPSRAVVECRSALLLSCLFGIQCMGFLQTGKHSNAVLYYGESKYYFAFFLAAGRAIYGEESMSTFSKKGATAKLVNDPKQAAKALVKSCWDDWQKHPARYKGDSAFARDMLAKFDELESQPVITGWCRLWRGEPAG